MFDSFALELACGRPFFFSGPRSAPKVPKKVP